VTLGIVVPAFNEERRIVQTLERLGEEASALGITELIVVDDGSSDRTAALVSAFAARTSGVEVRLLRHNQNRGKGAALRTGFTASIASAVGFVDADLSVGVEPFAHALRLVGAGADVVVGRRVPVDGASARPGQPLVRRVLGHMFVATQQRIVGVRYRDTQCPFKVLTRSAIEAVIPRCHTDGWAFDVEMLVVADRQGLRVAELPVHWRHVEGSTLHPGPRAAWSLLRELLAIRHSHGAAERS
jgi:glycosyltransferase involved in cell wall biosynthesis